MMFAGDTPAQIKANQEEFFNTLPKVTYANCSFNGSRSVRISGNYFELNLNGYNYCKIEHIRKGVEYTFYGFIDLYRYVNDECCEIDITCDFIQTYLTEIQLAAPFIDQRNYSLNADLYKTPYHNFYPVSRLIESSKIKLPTQKCLQFILAPNQEDAQQYFHGAELIFPFDLKNSNINTIRGVYLVCYPLDNNGDPIYDILDTLGNNKHLLNIYDFLNRFSGSIIDAGISEFFNIVINTGENWKLNPECGWTSINKYDDDNNILMAWAEYRYSDTGFSVIFSYNDLENKYIPALYVSPYYEYRIGRIKSYSTINPFNIGDNNKSIKLKLKSEIIGARDNIVIYDDVNSYESITNFKNPCGYMMYTKDAWEQYRNFNIATVGDSLATKHKYDLEIADRNRQAGKNKTTASGIGSAIKTLIGYVEDAISSVTSLLSGNTNIKIPITGIAKSATDIGVNTYKSITDINTAYENAKTNIQKERDLLELEYNNIRNAPNEVLNSGNGAYYTLYKEPYISIAVAENIDQIKKYHKKFGFQTSLQSDNDMTLSQLHDKAARHFDYIVTKNASVISENIPKSAAANIEKIFDNGIYLWRDYNKLGEDYFSNYNGE